MTQKTFPEKEVNEARIIARRGVPNHYDLIRLPQPALVAKKFLEESDQNFNMLNTAHEHAFATMMSARLLDALHGFKLPASETAIAWAFANALAQILGVEF